MNPTSAAGTRLWLPLVVLFFGCWPYCQLGGGMSSSSVTVPGKEGLFVKAEAAVKDRAARIELERTSREVTGGHEVVYVFSKTLIEQELRLVIGEGGQDLTFVIATHDAASSYATHGLEISPDGRRVAYKLGEEPWRVVYVLTGQHAVHGPAEFDTLDWAVVPTLDDAFVDVYQAQMLRLDGKFNFGRHKLLLTWAQATGGEKGLADRLFEIIVLRDHAWDTHLIGLSDPARARLLERLRTVVESGSATPQHWSKAWSTGAVRLDEAADVALAPAGARALAADDITVANNGVDLAAYLATWARGDVVAAAAVACDLVRTEDPPYALNHGRPLQLVVVATLVEANSRCAALDGFEADPCTPEAMCGAAACEPDELKGLARDVLARPLSKPDAGETPQDRATLARLVLAHRAASGLPTPTCGGGD